MRTGGRFHLRRPGWVITRRFTFCNFTRPPRASDCAKPATACRPASPRPRKALPPHRASEINAFSIDWFAKAWGARVITRRNLILGSGAAIAGGAWLAPGTALAASSTIALPDDLDIERLITVTGASTQARTVAMTFDDGPHPAYTPALLDILKARRIRASFYVIGRNVARYPDIVKRMVDEGHEIGNHSWQHPLLSQLGKAAVLRELDRTSEAVFRAVQRMPVTMRPPYGALTKDQRAMIHKEREMPTILWSVDPEDWRRPGSSVVADRIVGGARPGAIILSHDIHKPTVQAMPAALDGLIERGYRFATVSMILGQRDWSKLRWRLPKVAKS